MYPAGPNPANCPIAFEANTDLCRNLSRAWMFDRWTSMNGKPASSSASSIEYPTCVSAPALMITPLAPVDDSWMKSTIEPSWFD